MRFGLIAPRPATVDAHEQSLDELWREAETLGNVRIWTNTSWDGNARTDYMVTIIGKKRSTEIKVERRHTSIHCALADAITEAREMGLGEIGKRT